MKTVTVPVIFYPYPVPEKNNVTPQVSEFSDTKILVTNLQGATLPTCQLIIMDTKALCYFRNPQKLNFDRNKQKRHQFTIGRKRFT